MNYRFTTTELDEANELIPDLWERAKPVDDGRYEVKIRGPEAFRLTAVTGKLPYSFDF